MNGILVEVAFNFIPLVHRTFPKPNFWLLTSPSLLYTAVMLCHCRSQIKEPLRMNEWLLTQACFQREVAAAVLLYDCPVSKLGDLIVPSRHLHRIYSILGQASSSSSSFSLYVLHTTSFSHFA